MENRLKGKKDVDTVVGIVGTLVGVISIIVTVISIRQNSTKDKHQKSNRTLDK